MECVKIFIILFIIFLFKYSTINSSNNLSEERVTEALISDNSHLYKKPSILIVTLVRNKAHTLPLFLTHLEQQEYPKSRISLWIITDHNEDNSREILESWLKKVKNSYHSIHYQYDDGERLRKSESNLTHWSHERFLDIIRMKEEALDYARDSWVDYVFFLDADVFLTTVNTLDELVTLNKPIISPMLVSDALYSNFWCGMTSDYYYLRTEEYRKIRNYDLKGEHQVPMIHSAVLVDLNRISSDFLTFNATKLNNMYANGKIYDGPIDDIIIFAISAKFSNTKMFISNSRFYGYILVPLDQDEPIEKDFQQLINTKVAMINYYDEIRILPEFQHLLTYPPKTKFSFSKIFMINLKRRPERRIKMELTLKELGIDYEYFEAIDGRSLNDEILIQKGIQFMKGYEDPYHKRPMKMGEIGCFLSHYTIWQRMVEENLQEVLILEDDIKFEPFFRERTEEAMNEAHGMGGYDLIYFGRKRLQDTEEVIGKSVNFVKVSYTYWTLGYVITLDGAKKLLAAQPLKKLIPVDEFLPIMFNEHPNDTWKSNFENRNLIAWSVNPLLLYPTHYTGDDGYISDTEDSVQIHDEINPVENSVRNVLKQHHDSNEF